MALHEKSEIPRTACGNVSPPNPLNGSLGIVQVLPGSPHLFESNAARGERSGFSKNWLGLRTASEVFLEISFLGWT